MKTMHLKHIHILENVSNIASLMIHLIQGRLQDFFRGYAQVFFFFFFFLGGGGGGGVRAERILSLKAYQNSRPESDWSPSFFPLLPKQLIQFQLLK